MVPIPSKRPFQSWPIDLKNGETLGAQKLACVIHGYFLFGYSDFFAAVAAAGGKSLKITVLEIGAFHADSDMAYERTEFEFSKEDGTTFQQGK